MKFTGYTIREDFDLSNLKEYGFSKTEPAENIWWQRIFNIVWKSRIGVWSSELLVNKENRKLYMKYDEGINLNNINYTIERMKQDGVLVENNVSLGGKYEC